MSRIEWGLDRPYDAGVSQGVLYLPGQHGIPWDGLVAVDEKIEDTVDTERYFDGIRYYLMQSSENWVSTVTGFTCPREFEDFNGLFGFSFRTKRALHVVYNCRARENARGYTTNGDPIDPTLFAWDISATPEVLEGYSPMAHLVIFYEEAYGSVIAEIEDLLYGSETSDPSLPTMAGLIQVFVDASTLLIIDHGDGTWTANGPDEMVYALDATSFAINSPSVDYEDHETYTVSSY